MILPFDTVIDCGEGLFPQCIHDPNGKLRVIYLGSDSLVYCRETVPALGIYSNLTYRDLGRISPDYTVSRPSLKKVAHHGAYGFWSADGDHRFVIYMMPMDISDAFLDGSTSFSAQSEVFSLTANFINIHGQLLNRHRAVLSPGTLKTLIDAVSKSPEQYLGKQAETADGDEVEY